MQLNGKRVPLGQMFTPKPPGQGRGLITALVVLAVLAAVIIGLGSLVTANVDEGRAGGNYLLTVESVSGESVNVHWFEGGDWSAQPAVARVGR